MQVNRSVVIDLQNVAGHEVAKWTSIADVDRAVLRIDGFDALVETLRPVPEKDRPKALTASFRERKGANAVRNELKRLLGVKTMYELDRLDLEVESTFDQDLQTAATSFLAGLRTTRIQQYRA